MTLRRSSFSVDVGAVVGLLVGAAHCRGLFVSPEATRRSVFPPQKAPGIHAFGSTGQVHMAVPKAFMDVTPGGTSHAVSVTAVSQTVKSFGTTKVSHLPALSGDLARELHRSRIACEGRSPHFGVNNVKLAFPTNRTLFSACF